MVLLQAGFALGNAAASLICVVPAMANSPQCAASGSSTEWQYRQLHRWVMSSAVSEQLPEALVSRCAGGTK